MNKSRLAAILGFCLVSLLVPLTDADAAVKVVRVTKEGKLPEGTMRVQVTARCPKHAKVIGGGVQPHGLFSTDVLGSYPVDLSDADRTPDDGWRGIASNESGAPLRLTVFATCVRGLKPSYTSSNPVVFSSGRKARAIAPCASIHATLGGGAVVTGRSAHLGLTFSAPLDTADSDAAPDDGWWAEAVNRSGVDQAVRAYAICGPVSPVYVTSTDPKAPTAIQTSSIACPEPGDVLITGGIFVSTTNLDSEIVALEPVEEDGTWTKWANSFFNGTSSDVPAIETVICLEL